MDAMNQQDEQDELAAKHILMQSNAQFRDGGFPTSEELVLSGIKYGREAEKEKSLKLIFSMTEEIARLTAEHEKCKLDCEAIVTDQGMQIYKLKADLATAVEALELITRAIYVNIYEDDEFVRAIYPKDIAAEALAKLSGQKDQE